MSCLFTSEVTKSFAQACEKDYLDQDISPSEKSRFTLRDLRDYLVYMEPSVFARRKIMDADLVAMRLATIDGVQRFLQQNTKSGRVRAVAIFDSPKTLTPKAIKYIGHAKTIASYINSNKATQDALLDALNSTDDESDRMLRSSILMKVVDKMKLTEPTSKKRGPSPPASSSSSKKHKALSEFARLNAEILDIDASIGMETKAPQPWFGYNRDYKLTGEVVHNGYEPDGSGYVLAVATKDEELFVVKIRNVTGKTLQFAREAVITREAGKIHVGPALIRAWISTGEQLASMLKGLAKDNKLDPIIRVMLYMSSDKVYSPVFGVMIMAYIPGAIRLSRKDLDDTHVIENILRSLRILWKNGIEYHGFSILNILMDKEYDTALLLDFRNSILVDGEADGLADLTSPVTPPIPKMLSGYIQSQVRSRFFDTM